MSATSLLPSETVTETLVTPTGTTEGQQYLPLDLVIPSRILGRRRHAISSSSEPLFKSIPRMKRRGAISFENDDSNAEYIRFLGEALHKRGHPYSTYQLLPEMSLNLSIAKIIGRRGSIQLITPASTFKATLKGTILQNVNAEMQAMLLMETDCNIDTWDFDVFAFRRAAEGRPLYHLGSNLLCRHKMFTKMNLDVLKVMKFLGQVEEAYHPDNCYHNCTHAADVTQALHCLISEPKLYSQMTSAEVLAALLAALCHDLDHPGVNQNYLVNTSSHLASIHGPNSLLERHHCSQAKSILKETKLLDHLEEEERTEIISLMETLILATDVTQHSDFMKKLNVRIVSEEVDFSKKEDRRFILMIGIKAADISNPSRILHLSKCWSDHIMEEFFRQGDSEKSKQLPISFLCDRVKTAIPKSQSAFFQFVALPLFKAWSNLFDTELSVRLCKNIMDNKAYWDLQIPPDSDTDTDAADTDATDTDAADTDATDADADAADADAADIDAANTNAADTNAADTNTNAKIEADEAEIEVDP